MGTRIGPIYRPVYNVIMSCGRTQTQLDHFMLSLLCNGRLQAQLHHFIMLCYRFEAQRRQDCHIHSAGICVLHHHPRGLFWQHQQQNRVYLLHKLILQLPGKCQCRVSYSIALLTTSQTHVKLAGLWQNTAL